MIAVMKAIRREGAEIARKLARIIRAGVITLSGDDSFLQVEASDGELYGDVELYQHFGLSSRPPAGGDVVLAVQGGLGDAAIAIATNDRAHRPTGLQLGDAALYGALGTGQATVIVRANGDIEITPGTSGVVKVGSATATESILKGTTVAQDLVIFANALGAAVPAASLACGSLVTAIAAWPSLKGRVS